MYHCEGCGEEFSTWGDAVAHVEKEHLGGFRVYAPRVEACDTYYGETHYYGHPCPGCGEGFLWRSELRRNPSA